MMRFVLLMLDDPVANRIFEGCASRYAHQIVGVGVSTTLLQSQPVPLSIWNIWRRCGSRYFIANAFSWQAYRAKVAMSRTGMAYRRVFHLPTFARRRGIPVVWSDDFNGDFFRKMLAKWAPDVIVNRANQILRQPVLDLPTQGCLNIHLSLLPHYGGWAPNFWARANGGPESGVTIHRMIPTIDRGPIIAQERVPIAPGESVHSLQVRCADRATDMLAEADWVEWCDMDGYPQGEGSYCSLPTKEEVSRFQRHGGRLITWQDIRQTLFDKTL